MKPRKMKDSGIPWIGLIPEGWEARKIKTIFQVLGGATPASGNVDYWDGDIPWVTPADMSDDKIYLKDSKRKITREGLESCAAELVPVESIIVSNRAPIGKVALAGVPLCTNQGCKSLRASESVCSKYFYYYLRTQTETLNMFGQGTTFLELSSRSLNDFLVPYPAENEQSRIAAYLDEKCGEIDRVIAAKEQQNKLLRDQRTAIISEAVTKGLNPNAKFKDSGFEWLGEIPVDWCHLPLRYAVVSITGGATPQKENPLFWDGDIPWASSKDLKTNKIYKTEDSITKEGLERCSVSLIDAGRLILCARSGILRHTLPACVNMVPLTINQDLKALEFRKEINIYYVQYYFLGLNREILTFSQKEGATVESLNMELLMKLPIFFPRMPEQEKIVSYLDSRCAEIDQVIAANEGMVAKLKEYRSSLIWEAVTGKTSL